MVHAMLAAGTEPVLVCLNSNDESMLSILTDCKARPCQEKHYLTTTPYHARCVIGEGAAYACVPCVRWRNCASAPQTRDGRGHGRKSTR
eukprot:scaffold304522_cov25-Tisochrysis_lutea.AAC.1